MNAKPYLDETTIVPSAAPVLELIDAARLLDFPEASVDVGSRNGAMRRVSLYAPAAAFALEEELDFLTRRSIDQNVFFAPQFLIPAMPRLDDRHVRLMVVRDEAARRSRLRLLMPYSVERTGLFGGTSVIRAWTHPFGRLGTPLVDADDPLEALGSVLETLGGDGLGLPKVLVLPDLRIDGPFARTILAAAQGLGLPVAHANASDRAALVKTNATRRIGGMDSQDWKAESSLGLLSPKRRREVSRQRRLLERSGPVGFDVARDTVAVRHAMEEFLLLEASGWKGRERSALILDRYRAAFAREAVNKLAEKQRARIFTLRVAGQPVASLVAFVINGEAFAWKMAYDETHAQASPGLQMMLAASDALLADPSVTRVDSCAMPDHFLMNRLWKDRIRIETLIIGLRSGMGEQVTRTAKALENVSRTQNRARLLRGRVKAMFRLD